MDDRNFSRILKNQLAIKRRSKQEFDHADGLIEREDITHEKGKLVNRDNLMSNVGDDRMLHAYQDIGYFINIIGAIGERDQVMCELHKILQSLITDDLQFTRMKNGKTAEAEFSAGKKQLSMQQGYGYDLYPNDPNAQGQDDKGPSLMDRITGKGGERQ